MKEIYSREIHLIGEKNYKKLKNSCCIIFGVGGVGGYVLECLVRSGVGKITVVDFDKFDISNLNRQILSSYDNIGNYKVDEAVLRAKSINPNCEIIGIKEKLTADNIDEFNLQQYDYIIDAIDDVTAKLSLASYANTYNLPIISMMGAGNRYAVPHFEVADIFDTSYDFLAKKFRRNSKKYNIKKLDVVYTNIEAIKSREIGSVCYQVMSAGAVVASYVINKLINGEENG